MKQMLSIVAVLVLAVAVPAAAQTAPKVKPAPTVGAEGNRAVIERVMKLTRAEKEEFWPLYEKYEAAVGALDERMRDLITKYLASYENLDDRFAKVMMDEYMAIERDRLRLKRRYMKKFGRALPPAKTARFLQLENRLEAMTRAELATDIPLTR